MHPAQHAQCHRRETDSPQHKLQFDSLQVRLLGYSLGDGGAHCLDDCLCMGGRYPQPLSSLRAAASVSNVALLTASVYDGRRRSSTVATSRRTRG